MRSPIFSFFLLGCLVGALVGCQEESTKTRRRSRPITQEQPPVAEAPAAPATVPAETAPLSPTEIAPPIDAPMPITATIEEERLTLSCVSSFVIPESHDSRDFSIAVEVSNLDQNKLTELARFKGDVVELTSHLGTLTLSKRSEDAPAAYVAKATMNAPVFALVDEASRTPLTVACETLKPLPQDKNVRFQCDAEIASKKSLADAPEKITAKRETTLSISDDDRRFPLAELDDYRLVAYASQGEITMAVETLGGDWIGAAVGSIADSELHAEITLEKAWAKGSCRRLP